MSDPAAWMARAPVTRVELGVPAGGAAGVTAVARDGIGLATVMASRGASAALTDRVQARFGVSLPAGARREVAGPVSFVGIGPGAWLAMSEGGGNGFAGTLQEDLAPLAAVADQSDGYVLIGLDGPKVREALGKLVPIDLHARDFRVSDAASTVAAHIGVTLWRRADRPDGAAAFDLVLFRSMARSFWHALAEAGAEFGFAGGAARQPAGLPSTWISSFTHILKP